MSYASLLLVYVVATYAVCRAYEQVTSDLGLTYLAAGASMAIGAYFGISGGGWTSLGLAALAGLALGGLVGWSTARLTGEVFMVVSLSIQFAFEATSLGWAAVTGGAQGLSAPEGARGVFGYAPALAVSLCVAVSVAYAVKNRGYGVLLNIVRDAPLLATVSGINASIARALAFALSGLVAAAAGATMARATGYVSPSDFGLGASLVVFAGSSLSAFLPRAGAWIAVTSLVLLPELLRFAGLDSRVAGNGRQIAVGVALVLLGMQRRRRRID